MATVWLIGGTSESAALAAALSNRGVPCVITVTTAAAKRLYADMAQVRVGQLSSQTLPGFVDQWQVSCILDASHPFASEISRLAIALAQTQSIPYLRYERETIACTHQEADPSVILVDSVESLISSDILRHQRALFTVGYRYLSQFSHLRPDARLFARILPSVEAIAGATAAGFAPADIIALRPPVSAALEAALWQQWKITRVIAKASGVPSGEATKRKLANQLGIRLILIQRPQLVYPNQTNSVIEATDFCSKTILV
ncbi:MAG: cobalt-precorrin-6A reductase [Phormidesmis sp.]